MTKIPGPDCAVTSSLINTHTYIHTHTHARTHTHPWEDQCEWHRMTRMTGPDCAVMCNLIITHTHTHNTINCRILLLKLMLRKAPRRLHGFIFFSNDLPDNKFKTVSRTTVYWFKTYKYK